MIPRMLKTMQFLVRCCVFAALWLAGTAFLRADDGSPIRPGLSFINDVLPVLSKAGCNAGSCHAKPEGQNGFKLSVFAYDPKSDYRAIVKGDRGRRIFT